MSSKSYFKALSQLSRDYQAIIPRKLGRQKKPWMRHKEIELIVETIKALRPTSCLEWGSGYSTLYFPQFIPPEGNWLSIEHEPEWAEIIAGRNSNQQVEVRTILPNNDKWNGDGTLDDFFNYIKQPSSQHYDLILVDGRARLACVQEAKNMLTERGIIILHDANRTKYTDHLPEYAYSALYTDRRSGYGGIWLGSLQKPIGEVIREGFHQEVWRAHDQLARYFSFKPSK